MGQQNLRNRVASVTFERIKDGNALTYDYATHYSYDITGNVNHMVQDMPELDVLGHRFKLITYDYDLISGKVNQVYYQRDSADQFIHRYAYDEDNRIQYVETSHDGLFWERDASYEYNLHGPLGRTELGERRVQGLDYAYTLQGWLKGVNSSALMLTTDTLVSNFNTLDMGLDGKSGNTGDFARNKSVARDVIAFTLGYYHGDYNRITSGAGFEMYAASNSYFSTSTGNLYNGNIRHAVYTIEKLNVLEGFACPEGYTYRYDQLHRLRRMRSSISYTIFPGNLSWLVSGSDNDYLKEDVTYDANGNILTYKRIGNTDPVSTMDDLSYTYTAHTNRLTHIDDAQTNTAAYIGDLEDQEPNNYTYDRIGNLKTDDRDSITHIAWTTSQKIDTILKTDRYQRFTYNPMQQRVVKYTGVNGSDAETRTYYVRDAQGNVMAVYRMWMHLEETVPVYDSLKLTEWHIYGSSRVGLLQSNLDLIPAVESKQAVVQVIKTGMKRYELSNHLGNVLAVITDRKRGRSASGDPVQWYVADVLSTQQYYPFGMLMPGHAGEERRRQYTLGGYDYRYGFNGKEGDDEVKGDDNQQDYGMRIYDPRAGRFLSVDPIAKKYPELTVYQFSSNTPIQATDLDGLEANFSAGKIQRFELDGLPQTIPGKFLMNVGFEFYNSLLDLSELSVNLNPLVPGGIEKVQGDIANSAKGIYNYATTTSFDEFRSDLGRLATDVRTYESAAAMLAPLGLAKVAGASRVGLGLSNASQELSIGRGVDFASDVAKGGGLGNPFKNATLSQVDEAFQVHVQSGKLQLKYVNPQTGAKAYQNTISGYSYNLDPGRMFGNKLELPHIDVNYPNPKPLNVSPKKKLPVTGGF